MMHDDLHTPWGLTHPDAEKGVLPSCMSSSCMAASLQTMAALSHAPVFWGS
eukprot:CAMPEP_0174364316 /NCGR_PEP_ID=MMETSP0811_2-20130205/72422_1 /TAXON_ID=73025 ORGANISM="Eutreptiella gymnastica-like, Strain CCMP1594" /NCGR_SAMPLE_ID=MMETSP0811_2 /ASSEMBLY_ACC=CAM_ASM_000667 /LENGTH=50 /DNA_ID=CAMNT_0015503835 /DNA_START=25 /DNA_END=177 /DNA_ORIENTATION=-